MKKFLLFLVLFFPTVVFSFPTGSVHGTSGDLQEFSVDDYGGVANDGTSDHAALNAAIDAACSAGGGRIVGTPGGVYLVGETSPSNQFYRSVQIDCSDITFGNKIGVEPMRLRPLDPDGNVLIIVGSGQSGTVTPPANTTQVENTTVQNTVFEDDDPEAHASAIEESHGILVAWSKNTIIERNQFIGIGDEAIDIKGDLDGTQKYAEDILIQNNIADNSPSIPGGGAFVSVMNARRVAIDHNKCNDAVHAFTVDSVVSVRPCVALWSYESGIPVRDIQITNNVMTGWYTDMINLFPAADNIHNVLISGNTIVPSTTHGKTITSNGGTYYVTGLTIVDNYIRGMGIGVRDNAASVDFLVADAVISRNTIDGTVYEGTESGTSTTSTMEVTGADLLTNEMVGHYIECTSSTCADQKYRVTANDADTISISPSTWSGGAPNGATFRVMYHTYTALSGATATGGSSNTIVDSGAGWTVDAYQNLVVTVTAGTCNGQIRKIASNTSDTITLEGASTWTSCTPDGTTVFSVGNAYNTLNGSAILLSGTTGSVAISNNIVRNFAGAFFDSAINSATVTNNTVSNVGLAGKQAVRSFYVANNAGDFAFTGNTMTLDSAGTDVISTGSWPATSVRISDNTLVGTAAGSCVTGAFHVASDNILRGCLYGAVPTTTGAIISGNRIAPTSRGAYISSVSRIHMSNNYIADSAAAAVDMVGTADYGVVIGNTSYASAGTREIECNTLNGGVGANDVCLGNWDGNGVKDVLSPLGTKLTSGTTPPATCTVGEIFNDTDATAADQFLSCTATDTWTAQ